MLGLLICVILVVLIAPTMSKWTKIVILGLLCGFIGARIVAEIMEWQSLSANLSLWEFLYIVAVAFYCGFHACLSSKDKRQ